MIPKDNVSDVISALFDEAVDPRITVVGVGGAGGNVVGALYDSDLNGVETVAVNTDPAGLTKTEADVKILLKPTGPRRRSGMPSRRTSCSSSRDSAGPQAPGRRPSWPPPRRSSAPSR